MERAIARVGNAPKKDHREEQFYSYFSEIWPDGYENVSAKQYAAYLPYLPTEKSFPFLDIGCGAGEFVHFLDTHGIRAQGIDINAVEIARAKERGLEVYQDDAISYLLARPTSFSGISLLEVIEHLPQESMSPLLSVIFQALIPGGVVLLETINLKHPLAFHSFYTDPTHTRPISSDYLVFLTQWHGFFDVQIIYTTPLAYTNEQSHDPSRSYFNYALVGRKPVASL